MHSSSQFLVQREVIQPASSTNETTSQDGEAEHTREPSHEEGLPAEELATDVEQTVSSKDNGDGIEATHNAPPGPQTNSDTIEGENTKEEPQDLTESVKSVVKPTETESTATVVLEQGPAADSEQAAEVSTDPVASSNLNQNESAIDGTADPHNDVKDGIHSAAVDEIDKTSEEQSAETEIASLISKDTSQPSEPIHPKQVGEQALQSGAVETAESHISATVLEEEKSSHVEKENNADITSGQGGEPEGAPASKGENVDKTLVEEPIKSDGSGNETQVGTESNDSDGKAGTQGSEVVQVGDDLSKISTNEGTKSVAQDVSDEASVLVDHGKESEHLTPTEDTVQAEAEDHPAASRATVEEVSDVVVSNEAHKAEQVSVKNEVISAKENQSGSTEAVVEPSSLNPTEVEPQHQPGKEGAPPEISEVAEHSAESTASAAILAAQETQPSETGAEPIPSKHVEAAPQLQETTTELVEHGDESPSPGAVLASQEKQPLETDVEPLFSNPADVETQPQVTVEAPTTTTETVEHSAPPSSEDVLASQESQHLEADAKSISLGPTNAEPQPSVADEVSPPKQEVVDQSADLHSLEAVLTSQKSHHLEAVVEPLSSKPTDTEPQPQVVDEAPATTAETVKHSIEPPSPEVVLASQENQGPETDKEPVSSKSVDTEPQYQPELAGDLPTKTEVTEQSAESLAPDATLAAQETQPTETSTEPMSSKPADAELQRQLEPVEALSPKPEIADYSAELRSQEVVSDSQESQHSETGQEPLAPRSADAEPPYQPELVGAIPAKTEVAEDIGTPVVAFVAQESQHLGTTQAALDNALSSASSTKDIHTEAVSVPKATESEDPIGAEAPLSVQSKTPEVAEIIPGQHVSGNENVPEVTPSLDQKSLSELESKEATPRLAMVENSGEEEVGIPVDDNRTILQDQVQDATKTDTTEPTENVGLETKGSSSPTDVSQPTAESPLIRTVPSEEYVHESAAEPNAPVHDSPLILDTAASTGVQIDSADSHTDALAPQTEVHIANTTVPASSAKHVTDAITQTDEPTINKSIVSTAKDAAVQVEDVTIQPAAISGVAIAELEMPSDSAVTALAEQASKSTTDPLTKGLLTRLETLKASGDVDEDEAASVADSTVPRVPLSPRSDLGIFTPSFDTRSEVSDASREPLAPNSPRLDPEGEDPSAVELVADAPPAPIETEAISNTSTPDSTTSLPTPLVSSQKQIIENSQVVPDIHTGEGAGDETLRAEDTEVSDFFNFAFICS